MFKKDLFLYSSQHLPGDRINPQELFGLFEYVQPNIHIFIKYITFWFKG